MRTPLAVTAVSALALLAPAPLSAQSLPAQPVPEKEESAWCAEGLLRLAHDTCAFVPSPEKEKGPRTLVVFLHGVVKADSGWQKNQQLAAARAGKKHGFSVLMPRGRRGIGPKGMEDWWTWPTSHAAQAEVEGALLAEWEEARAELEKRGRPYERLWVFGFSNGAYYATSLAMRARFPADGFAAFAGGSGAKHHEKAARRVPKSKRARFFVAWGGKDKAHRDQTGLARMLRRLGWPSRASGHPKAGHAMTDKQVEEAIAFLGRR